MQESDAHLLFDFSLGERQAEFFKRYHVVFVVVTLEDCSIDDAPQLYEKKQSRALNSRGRRWTGSGKLRFLYLFLRDVGSDHHVQDRQQLFPRYFAVLIQIVHFESNWNVRHLK